MTRWNSSEYHEPPLFERTSDRLRWQADRLGSYGLGYISAAQLRAIADELDEDR